MQIFCFDPKFMDNLGKFDPKFDVGIFLGYSNTSKAYRVYNKRTLVVEESLRRKELLMMMQMES